MTIKCGWTPESSSETFTFCLLSPVSLGHHHSLPLLISNKGLFAVNLLILYPTGTWLIERHPHWEDKPPFWNTFYQIWSRLITSSLITEIIHCSWSPASVFNKCLLTPLSTLNLTHMWIWRTGSMSICRMTNPSWHKTLLDKSPILRLSLSISHQCCPIIHVTCMYQSIQPNNVQRFSWTNPDTLPVETPDILCQEYWQVSSPVDRLYSFLRWGCRFRTL